MLFVRLKRSSRIWSANLRQADAEDIRMKREIGLCRSQMAETLSHTFFHAVSEASILPLGSSVLQRRPGYREILNAWLKFHLAAMLDWSGGEDVYGGGKRDVATLYEYWVFFQLLQLLIKKFSLPTASVATLLERTGDRFGLRLKTGTHVSIDGVFIQAERSFRMKFSFNRTFLRLATHISESSYPAAGSWTRRMRPDYTLSLWPSAYDEEKADTIRSSIFISMQSTVSINCLSSLAMMTTRRSRTLIERGAEGRTAKREDLLKMHAYRDAIRRSEGAYVLYPGTEHIKWRGYHELLPGLGAFAITPEDGERGLQELSIFIEDAVTELALRNSQREQTAYQIYRIHKNAPDGSGPRAPFPEIAAGDERLPPPNEELALVCPRFWRNPLIS